MRGSARPMPRGVRTTATKQALYAVAFAILSILFSGFLKTKAQTVQQNDFIRCASWQNFNSEDKTVWITGYEDAVVFVLGIAEPEKGARAKGFFLPDKLTVGEISHRVDMYCKDVDKSKTTIAEALADVSKQMR